MISPQYLRKGLPTHNLWKTDVGENISRHIVSVCHVQASNSGSTEVISNICGIKNVFNCTRKCLVNHRYEVTPFVIRASVVRLSSRRSRTAG